MARDKKKSIRMSTKEELLVEKKAMQADMVFSTFVREAALNHPVVVVPGIRELYVQVARVGNNLNQLTMLCHQGRITSVDLTETREMLSKVYEKLYEIGEVLEHGNSDAGTG